MIKERLFYFSVWLHFAVVCLLRENFCFEKLLSDMVPTFQRDYVEKMYFDIVFNKDLHHVEMLGPCQTLWIFLIHFMSLSWHHGSQNNLYLNQSQNGETRNRNFQNLYLNIFLTKIFDWNPSIYDDKTNWDNYNLGNFDSM